MRCAEYQEFLTRLIGGELDAARWRECERHERECPACATRRAGMGALPGRVRAAAVADATQAEAALAGFEDRVLARVRELRRAEALGVNAPAPRRLWRWAFGLSLACNVCAAAVFLFVIGSRGNDQSGGAPRRMAALPAGLPAPAQLAKMFAEVETLFGDRLEWISDCGGQVALGIQNDPSAAAAAPPAQGPPVALVYWLDAADGASHAPRPAPVVILTRAGGALRERIIGGGEHAPIEISVDGLTRRRDAFAIRTQVRPAAPGAAGGVSSLAASLDLRPGTPAKLGEVRLDGRVYNSYLAVQTLYGTGGHDRAS